MTADPTIPTANVFGATTDDVKNLLPGAEFPTDLRVGQKGVTTTMVRGYIERVTGTVLTRIVGWDGLSPERRTAAREAARTVVVDGAGSYAQAARHPDRTSPNDDTYAGVLWQRHLQGLKVLEGQVAGWIEEENVEPPRAEKPGYHFPPPRATESMRF